MLLLGDPDQPKSATKAGLKQKLAENGRALDLSEEIHSKAERKLQQRHSKLKLARAKQTSVVKDRVGVKMAKIKERALTEIESVKANAYDEAEVLVGKEWGKDIELVKRLRVRHEPKSLLLSKLQPQTQLQSYPPTTTPSLTLTPIPNLNPYITLTHPGPNLLIRITWRHYRSTTSLWPGIRSATAPPSLNTKNWPNRNTLKMSCGRS